MSVFSQLAARRVPQLIGLYVAGTWMAIEIGDWLIEKFGLPDTLTAYIFVALAVLLPSVALVAWNHGAPGRDQWTRLEKVFVPLNVLAALGAVSMIERAPGATVAEAKQTTMMTVVDETGASQSFEVAVGQHHRRMAVFFLHNELGDEDKLEWLSYGLPALIAHDLDHETPLVTAATPLHSASIKDSLQERGFTDLRGAPRALQLSIARESNSSALLTGRLYRSDEGIARADIQLVDVDSGTDLFIETLELDEPLLAADDASQRVQNELGLDPRSDAENDPLSENYSANVEAVRLLIEALMVVELTNDYPTGIRLMDEALALDNTFASAQLALANLYFLSGDSASALSATERALVHDYKLSTGSKFLSKARRYIYANDIPRGLQVLELWSKIEPQNPAPFELLGKILMLSGRQHDAAIEAINAALELNPSHHALLKDLAGVEQSRGRFAEAAAYAQRYIEARPEDGDAHMLLASVYMGASDYDQAEKAFLDAELLAADNLNVSLGLAALDVRLGRFDSARSRLDAVLGRELTPQQRVMALNGLADLAYARGQIDTMLATLNDIDAEAQKFLPPILRVIQVGMTRVNGLALRGETPAARVELDGMRETLQPPFDGYLILPRMNLDWRDGDYEAAMTGLQRAEEFAAARGDPSYEMIMAYARAHRPAYEQDVAATRQQVDRAAELLERAAYSAIMNTSNAVLELQVDLARLLHSVGAVDAARALVGRILKRAPYLGSAHLLLAQLAFDLENLEEAQASLDTALEVWSDADDRYVLYAEAQQLKAQLSN